MVEPSLESVPRRSVPFAGVVDQGVDRRDVVVGPKVLDYSAAMLVRERFEQPVDTLEAPPGTVV